MIILVFATSVFAAEKAKRVDTSVANFDNNLSGSDTNVQSALDTLDDLSVTGELTDLSDVNTSTPTSGNVLIADGVDWESQSISGDATVDSTGAVTVADDSHAHTGSTLTEVGDVESVGDCTGGACLDGTSDGGSAIELYRDPSSGITYIYFATSDTGTRFEFDGQFVYLYVNETLMQTWPSGIANLVDRESPANNIKDSSGNQIVVSGG